jgi:hypothetical protein
MPRFPVLFIAALLIGAGPAYSSSTAEQFSPFLRRFVADQAFRESRIILPLEAHVGSRCEDDVKRESWDQPALQKSFTPPLSGSALRSEGLSRNFEYRKAEVRMQQFREEADSYEILYVFQLREGRWYLVKYHDESC